MNKKKRLNDIEELVKGLDITPTMHRNATEKYKNIAKYFEQKGIECDIYPLGSFSLGTVVRPYKNAKDADYDLDFIACIHEKKCDIVNAKNVKYVFGDSLKENKIYSDRLQKEWDKCWTLSYSDVNDVGFNMDIIPATKESDETVLRLSKLGVPVSEAKKAIAITNKVNDDIYEFITSNPKAFKKWFVSINEPYALYNRETRLNELLVKSRGVYNSIEEIPPTLERSALQRVIQLLKRHRDIYFEKKKSNKKPVSIIITTLVAEIAKELPNSLGVYDLFHSVVVELTDYSDLSVINEVEFYKKYTSDKLLIRKTNGKWWISNPVNPEENLADGWEDEIKAKSFFEWIEKLKKDFIDSLNDEDEKFSLMMGNAFGNDYFTKSSVSKNYEIKKPSPIANKPKQWGL